MENVNLCQAFLLKTSICKMIYLPYEEILRHSIPLCVFVFFKQLSIRGVPRGMQQHHCAMRDAGAHPSVPPKAPGSQCQCHCPLHGGLTNTKLRTESWAFLSSPAIPFLLWPAISRGSSKWEQCSQAGRAAALRQVSADPATLYPPALKTPPKKSLSFQKAKESHSTGRGKLPPASTRCHPCDRAGV